MLKTKKCSVSCYVSLTSTPQGVAVNIITLLHCKVLLQSPGSWHSCGCHVTSASNIPEDPAFPSWHLLHTLLIAIRPSRQYTTPQHYGKLPKGSDKELDVTSKFHGMRSHCVTHSTQRIFNQHSNTGTHSREHVTGS